MGSSSNSEDQNRVPTEAERLAKNSIKSETHQAQNQARAEVRKRLGFLSRFTNMFRR